uniref:Putative licpodalin-4 1 n=1 Tax=Amblyomma triste TaxID=251400 RepID=A0A023GA25_AMBTT
MNGLGAAFLLVIGVTACAADRTTKDDLRRALNTEQKIWVVKRSYKRYTEGQEHKCVYAKKDSLEGDNYQFHQGYKVGEEWKKEQLYGVLSEDGGFAKLKVSKKKGEEGITYTLNAWNHGQKCGILTFQKQSNEFECELHAWDEVLTEGADPCAGEYQQICGGKAAHQVFSHECLTGSD